MEKGNYSHVLQAAANRKNATPPPEPADDQAEPVPDNTNTREQS